jgi:MFS family permease
MLVLFVIGFIGLAGWVPPPDPAASAQEIAAMFREDTTEIRLGMFTSMLSMSLMAPFGVAIAAQIRRTEGRRPVLTYTQLVCVAVGTTVIVLSTVVWAVAAFRPDEYSPDTVRIFNDLGWFLFLIEWPPFSIWFAAVAIAILRDENDPPVFPRWSAYLSLWSAFLFVAAGLIMFFKTGPFAWDGLIAFYVAVAIFFVWLVAMTVLVIKAINREAEQAPVDRGADEATVEAPVRTVR